MQGPRTLLDDPGGGNLLDLKAHVMLAYSERAVLQSQALRGVLMRQRLLNMRLENTLFIQGIRLLLKLV